MKKVVEIQLTYQNRIPNELRVEYFRAAIKNGMSLMTYDLETCHATVRTFYIGSKVSIRSTQVVHPVKIMLVQYATNDGKPLYMEWDKVSTKYEGVGNFDDARLVSNFIDKVLPKADILLTQNGDSFDFRTLNERAKMAKANPPLMNIPSIDILKLSRQSVRALSHKLDYRSEQQSLGGKNKMVDQDWVDIEENGVSLKKKMIPYGLKDVKDTRSVFWAELPYYKTLPKNVEDVVIKYLTGGMYVLPKAKKDIACPTCRKKKQKATDVSHVRGVNYHCNNCNKNFSINNL